MKEEKNDKNLEVSVYQDEVKKLLKKYKKIKKYQKSPLYTIKVMDGTETIISSLLGEIENNEI
jgi:hypothetical protein